MFYTEIPYSGFAIMLTYYAAQLGISLNVLDALPAGSTFWYVRVYYMELISVYNIKQVPPSTECRANE